MEVLIEKAASMPKPVTILTLLNLEKLVPLHQCRDVYISRDVTDFDPNLICNFYDFKATPHLIAKMLSTTSTAVFYASETICKDITIDFLMNNQIHHPHPFSQALHCLRLL